MGWRWCNSSKIQWGDSRTVGTAEDGAHVVYAAYVVQQSREWARSMGDAIRRIKLPYCCYGLLDFGTKGKLLPVRRGIVANRFAGSIVGIDTCWPCRDSGDGAGVSRVACKPEKHPYRSRILVAVVFGFKRSRYGNADILRLFFGQFCELRSKFTQVQSRNLFVEFFGKNGDSFSIFFCIAVQFDLRHDLVGERCAHHEARGDL